MDTQDGTGGVPLAPLAANSSVSFPVAGIGQVPATGVSDVYVVLTAIGPTASGCLDDFDPDAGDSGLCSATFDAGSNVTDSDVVQVSDSGEISLSNISSGTVDAAVTVIGYFTDGSQATAGETYVPLPADQIVDTSAGQGAPKAQIPANGTLTVQVSGLDGVPSDAAGAVMYIGAINSAATGDVSAYPAGGTASSLSLLSYVPGRAVHDLYFGALSSTGADHFVESWLRPCRLESRDSGILGQSGQPRGWLDLSGRRAVPTSRYEQWHRRGSRNAA